MLLAVHCCCCFSVRLCFPDSHIWITSSKLSLLASTPAPTHRVLHICMHQGLLLDYRVSSPWVIQLTPFSTINNYAYTSNSQLSPVSNLLWVPHLRKTNDKWKYDLLLVISPFNPHHSAKIPSDHLLLIFLLWMRSLSHNTKCSQLKTLSSPSLVLPPVIFVTDSHVS